MNLLQHHSSKASVLHVVRMWLDSINLRVHSFILKSRREACVQMFLGGTPEFHPRQGCCGKDLARASCLEEAGVAGSLVGHQG